MKKIMISAALLTVLGAPVSAFANDARDGVKGASKATVETATKNGVYNLVYRSAAPGIVKVTITNEVGQIVMFDQIEANSSFLRPYNLIALPAGSYTITVLDRNGKTSMPLVHAATSLASLARPTMQVKPVEAKKYALTLLGIAADAVTVNIYDDKQNLVFTEEIAGKGSFTRVYDLTKIYASNFNFEVISNGQVVSQK